MARGGKEIGVRSLLASLWTKALLHWMVLVSATRNADVRFVADSAVEPAQDGPSMQRTPESAFDQSRQDVDVHRDRSASGFRDDRYVAGARPKWSPEKLRELAGERCVRPSEDTDVLSCAQCAIGYVLVDGPPSNPGDGGKMEDEYRKVGLRVRDHCAEILNEKLVVMIRHGESKWNSFLQQVGGIGEALGWQHRWTDSPLSMFGLREAQRLANILQRADTARATQHPDDSQEKKLAFAALDEIDTDVQKKVRISAHGTDLSDDQLRQDLQSEDKELELAILLGKKCNETIFSSSQLVRAMDTLNIALLPARLRCDAPYEISSNLQELGYNKDCSASNRPNHSIAMNNVYGNQFEQYLQNQMKNTGLYMEARYASSDTSRYLTNHGKWQQSKKLMTAEVASLFTGPRSLKKYAVWGGHSVWFREFFALFRKKDGGVCEELGRVRITNTGIASAKVYQTSDVAKPWVLTDCKWIYLGPSNDYKLHVSAGPATEPMFNTIVVIFAVLFAARFPAIILDFS